MMTKYYLSRALFAIILAALMAAFGLIWWGAALIGLAIFAGFVVVGRSGRYVVDPKGGAAPMRRDELGQEINRRAGLSGFVTLILGLGALTIYYGGIAHSSVPVNLLEALLVLGLLAYILTDYRLRKM
ncbi:MAG: hypothetical protein M1281_09685 [Chloroflexi bacterium]|nr:hypothetical protein [Chloroflexota bacterium]